MSTEHDAANPPNEAPLNTDTDPNTRPLTPQERRRTANPTGQPITIKNQTWFLKEPGLSTAFDGLRDEIHDDSLLRNKVKTRSIQIAAFMMLMANYDLTPEEAWLLILSAEPQALLDATYEAIYHPGPPVVSYTAWARSALIANGINPATIEARDLDNVLDQLVATKRAIPREDFTHAGQAQTKRANFTGYAPTPSSPD